jgi:hypothetical protein
MSQARVREPVTAVNPAEGTRPAGQIAANYPEEHRWVSSTDA